MRHFVRLCKRHLLPVFQLLHQQQVGHGLRVAGAEQHLAGAVVHFAQVAHHGGGVLRVQLHEGAKALQQVGRACGGAIASALRARGTGASGCDGVQAAAPSGGAGALAMPAAGSKS